MTENSAGRRSWPSLRAERSSNIIGRCPPGVDPVAGFHAGALYEMVTRRIATHRKPDADAIAAVWLAEAYLFAGEDIEVAFVPRCRPGMLAGSFDCVVDVSNAHDPDRLVFD